jgi:hypothetical protein
VLLSKEISLRDTETCSKVYLVSQSFGFQGVVGMKSTKIRDAQHGKNVFGRRMISALGVAAGDAFSEKHEEQRISSFRK